jgi:CheY-like chemotaxis protein
MTITSEPIARVIVAEDNATNRYVICAMLRGFGAEIVVAHDGVEAVAIALATPFTLILMDINMPRLNGVEAAKKILATPGFANSLIFAVTANATLQQKQECKAAGFSGFITKPIDADAFEAQMGKYLIAI